MRIGSSVAPVAVVAAALALAACTSDRVRDRGGDGPPAVAAAPVEPAAPAAPVVGPMDAGSLAKDTGLKYEDLGLSVLLSNESLRARFFPNNDKVSIDGQMLSMGEAARRDAGVLVVPPDGVKAVRRAVAAARAKQRERSVAVVPIPLPPLPPAPTPVKAGAPAPRATGPAPIAAGPGWVPAAADHRWTWIVIHHSDDREGSCGKYDRVHRDKGWEGCGYHFVVGNGTQTADGEVEASDRWREQRIGAHTRVSPTDNRYNEHGIGICLVGDFDKGRGPTAAQYQSLVRLTRWLMARYGVTPERVLPHRACKATECPGKNFPWAAFKADIETPPAPNPP